jgi:hypothetical protein
MEKYSIHQVTYDSNTFFCVYENATEQVYDFFLFENEAKTCKTFLDLGGSFDGFTPSFMLRKIVVPSDINSVFSEL